MSILFCDTDCELWFTTAEELDLKIIEMPYTIDGTEKMYDLGKNTDFKGFFDRMRAGSTPITSGLNPETYIDIFEPYFKAGEDILYIAFSSKMSNTFKYLDIAIDALKAKYPNTRYRLFDTLNISMGAGMLVYLAAKYFKTVDGDIDKTYDYLNTITGNVCTTFVVDDLKYLARGGRLSPSKAKMGNLMQVKPVLRVGDSGEIEILCKQNGSKKAMSFVIAEFEKKYKDIDGAPIVAVGADCDDAVELLVRKVKEICPSAEVWIQPVGPVIGAHCGPGTYGLIYTSTSR